MARTFVLLSLAVSIASCVSIDVAGGDTPTPVAFVTSTLGPTAVPPRIATASTAASASVTLTPGACTPRAVLLQDVTVPDDTRMLPGQRFVKTWRFQNTGSCNWEGLHAAFTAGDRMGAPDATPIDSLAPEAQVDVSVDLTAPANDGIYTGYFELRTPSGDAVPIGIHASFWVRIIVGDVAATAPAPGTPVGSPLYTPGGPLSCDYRMSAPYHAEIAALINGARRSAGLPELVIDARLAAAAQDHSIDMACFGLLSHSGSDGSSPGQRVGAAGYSGFLEEIIYASGYPQTAFDWWMNDQVHRDAILNPRARSMGVGYAYVETSLYGGYYTVDFGSQ